MDQKILKIAVVGGSISGLMAAVALRAAGHSVTVLERSPEEHFVDQGSGLGLRPEVGEFLNEYISKEDVVQVQLGSKYTTVLELDGSIGAKLELPARSKVSSWSALVRGLIATFNKSPHGHGSYLYGANLTKISETSDKAKVTAVYQLNDKEHTLEELDFIIGADGSNSTVRRLMLGEEVPRTYAGYILHRAVVPANDIDASIHELYKDSVVAQTNGGITTISYYIPGGDPDVSEHDVMIACYGEVDERELQQAMLGSDGKQYSLTLPAGKLREDRLKHIKANMMNKLSPQFQALLSTAPRERFILSKITDLKAPQNSFLNGKVLTVSEAVSVLRPHGFAGTAQAAFHAKRLLDLVQGRLTVDQWSQICLTYSSMRQKEATNIGHTLVGPKSIEGTANWSRQMEILKRTSGEIELLMKAFFP